MAAGRRSRSDDPVVVPTVVGLEVQQAQRVAGEAGVALAQPDPDGPPLGALTWPGRCVVTAQSPPAGAVVQRWGSVVVRFAAAGDGTAGDREPRRPSPLAPPAAAPATAARWTRSRTTAGPAPDGRSAGRCRGHGRSS